MKKVICIVIAFAFFRVADAQISISIDGSKPDPSAMLDIKSLDKGILVPRLNDTTDVSNPVQGLLVFMTKDKSGFYYYNSGKWSRLSTIFDKNQPGTHTHTEAEITDLSHYTDSDIDGNETAFNNWDKDVTDDFSKEYADLLNKPDIYEKTDIDLMMNLKVFNVKHKADSTLLHNAIKANKTKIKEDSTGLDNKITTNLAKQIADSTKLHDLISANNHWTKDTDTIATNLRIGINTSNPKAHLHVEGQIYTKSLKTEAFIPFPDYVFEEGYKISSLEEVDEYIKTNGHLKGIPKASEVHENGIDIGIISTKLVEKVEELTLYLIQLNKENKELKKRLKILESE